MLTKETVIDLIQVTERGVVQVRRATYIVEDGVRVAGPNYDRASYMPDADVSAEDPKVQAIAAAAWK